MADVVLYTKEWCGFCFRAKSLLELNGVAFEEIDVERSPEREREMIERTGGRMTVPQVFVRGQYVGGSEELARLAMSGGLDGLARADAGGEEE